MKFYSQNHETYVTQLIESVHRYYQERLYTFAVFGSYARQENRPNSDIDFQKEWPIG